MNLYIPEIGDHIVLTEDWTFNLHPEYRNEDMAAYLGHYLKLGGWIDGNVLPPMRPVDYSVEYPDREDPKFYTFSLIGGNKFCTEKYNTARQLAEQECKARQVWQAEFNVHYDTAQKILKDVLIVTIPKGTVLSIDRIYIRKGSSDFSSLTFYAKGLGNISVKSSRRPNAKNKKALRFWAKLDDCNNIKFEKISK